MGYFYNLDPDPGPWTRIPDPDPGPWTQTLDSGSGPWTLDPKNLDPEKPGINIGLKNMSDFR